MTAVRKGQHQGGSGTNFSRQGSRENRKKRRKDEAVTKRHQDKRNCARFIYAQGW
ncbi:MAG: hypothetical protein HY432_01915 [Candidatus Liptonbacteria bacterium]|nr:hypothetical protein [Candidatus Liptonbacteria bacterium]